jgi:hypothetical protein
MPPSGASPDLEPVREEEQTPYPERTICGEFAQYLAANLGADDGYGRIVFNRTVRLDADGTVERSEVFLDSRGDTVGDARYFEGVARCAQGYTSVVTRTGTFDHRDGVLVLRITRTSSRYRCSSPSSDVVREDPTMKEERYTTRRYATYGVAGGDEAAPPVLMKDVLELSSTGSPDQYHRR